MVAEICSHITLSKSSGYSPACPLFMIILSPCLEVAFPTLSLLPSFQAWPLIKMMPSRIFLSHTFPCLF